MMKIAPILFILVRSQAFLFIQRPLQGGLQSKYRVDRVPRLLSTESSSSAGVVASDEKNALSSSSFIESIKSFNLAGVVDGETGGEVSVSFGPNPCLVAVSGETGSGKSLLVAKLVDLATGGKATSSLVAPTNEGEEKIASVEMTLRLGEPHLSIVEQCLGIIGVDMDVQDASASQRMATIVLKRTLMRTNGKTGRLSSLCEVNGKPVTMKDVRSIFAPLLAVVDASAAANALSRVQARLAALDTAVSAPVLHRVKSAQKAYRLTRAYREKLESELNNRLLPQSVAGDRDIDTNLLRHWVDELNAFKDRMQQFCEMLSTIPESESALMEATKALATATWTENLTEDGPFSSRQYDALVKFRGAVQSIDSKLESARLACECLSSLSSTQSAATALESARNHLYDVSGDEMPESPISQTTEKTHDFLNVIEKALQDCVNSFENDSTGLFRVLEMEREAVEISLEEIDALIGDWNHLSRKHGMSPHSLPACHNALRMELDGNVEAQLLLPRAIEDEATALELFEAACSELSAARQKVAGCLSASVTDRMPSLGMEGSRFEVDLLVGARRCTDESVYQASNIMGIDKVDFRLIHGTEEGSNARNTRRGGNLETVGSAGEKARILLAIECELPGAIGASCRNLNNAGTVLSNLPYPVAVLYDEIDAHVGGRAAVAMAEMIADQSRAGQKDRCQVISITHSPTVAAIADLHLVVQKQPAREQDGQRCIPVTAKLVNGALRRKELARMAAGDVAQEEAEMFADALLRDARSRREAGDSRTRT